MRSLGLSKNIWKYYNTVTSKPNRGPLFSDSVQKFGTLYLTTGLRYFTVLQLFTLQHTACLLFVVKHEEHIKQRNLTELH